MYFYIYDNFTSKPEYQKKINQIGLKLVDLGIADEKARATPIRPVEILVKEALADGRYKNIIAVGDDQTANQIINALAASQAKVTFGIIPLRTSKIAQALSIPKEEAACQQIAARKLNVIDLGKVNNQYFLTSIKIEAAGKNKIKSFFRKIIKSDFPCLELNFNDNFKIKTSTEIFLLINVPTYSDLEVLDERKEIRKKISPKDGLLDLVILSKSKKLFTKSKHLRLTYFQTKKIDIKSTNPILATCDNQIIKKLPLHVEIVPQCFEVIVGKKTLGSHKTQYNL